MDIAKAREAMKAARLLVGIAACLTAPHVSAREDLVNCLYSNGAQMEQRICDHLRRREAEAAARQQALEEQWRQEREARERVDADRKAEQDRVRAEEDASRKARWEEEQAARKRAEETERARQAAEDARAEKWVGQRKKECGSDFGIPSVGMTLDRAKRCVGDFALYSQLNRADGVVSMYRAGVLHISVMNGRIVHWARY